MSSTRLRLQPMPCRRSARCSGSCRSFCGLLERHAVELGGGVLDRFDDVLIAGAAAEVAGNAEADLRLGRALVLLQQPIGAKDHSGRAEPALQAVHLAEAFLPPMQ